MNELGELLMRAGRLACVLVAAVLPLSGCMLWPYPWEGPDRAAFNAVESTITPANVASLRVAWQAPLDEGPAGDPVQSNAGVHVSGPRTAYGFVEATGVRRWSRGVAAPGKVAPVFGAGDYVRMPTDTYVGGSQYTDEATQRLDAATGQLVDSVSDGELIAQRGGDQAFFSSFVPPIGGVDVSTLELKHADGTSWSGFFGEQSPVGKVPLPIVTLGTRWLYDAGQGPVSTTEPYAPWGNALRGFSLTNPNKPDGNIVLPDWFVTLNGTTAVPPVLGPKETTVYTATDAGTVYAIDVATMTVKWTGSIGTAAIGGLALGNGVLFVPTAAGALFAFAADGCGGATCEAKWGASAGSKMTVRPAIAGGVVYTGSADGVVHAANANGCGSNLCPMIWSGPTGSAISGGPSVFNGRVFVGTADGRVVAFGLP